MEIEIIQNNVTMVLTITLDVMGIVTGQWLAGLVSEVRAQLRTHVCDPAQTPRST